MAKPHQPVLAHLDQELVLFDGLRREWAEACIRAVEGHAEIGRLTAASSEDDGFWPPPDDWRAAYRPYIVRNGVLQVPVQGILLNRFSFALGSWATGYTYIQRAVQRGMADPDVRGIAFIIHSPGGEAAGNFELVEKLYGFRGQKPMRAFAADAAYSAAYSIASAADRIISTRTGGLGSIGVVTMHIDYSEALDQEGVRITFVFAGKYKVDGNPFEKLSAHAKARMQGRVDRLMDIFVETVARNRGISATAVRDTEADCYGPEEAISLGLCDQVQIFEDALIAFSDELDPKNEDDEMANGNQTTSPAAQVQGVAQADHDAAVAAAREEGLTAGRTEGQRAGVTAERTRITTILASEAAKKRPKAALSAALKTEMTAEQAEAFLTDLPEETAAAPATTAAAGNGALGQMFTEAMRRENPEVGAGEVPAASGGAPADEAKRILADSASIVGNRKKQKAA